MRSVYGRKGSGAGKGNGRAGLGHKKTVSLTKLYLPEIYEEFCWFMGICGYDVTITWGAGDCWRQSCCGGRIRTKLIRAETFRTSCNGKSIEVIFVFNGRNMYS